MINYKIIKKIRISNKTIITLALLVILSIILKSVNLIIIAISLNVAYRLLSPRISEKVFDSKLFLSTLIFFSYIILLQCTVLVSWLLSKNYSLSFTPLLLLVILLVMYSYDYFINKKEARISLAKTNKKIFNIQDILSLLTAVIIVGIIVIPPLSLKPEYAKPTSIMSLIAGNVDDASHLSLLNDSLQFDRGIMFKSDVDGKTRNGDFYPAGWSSISAILIKTFCPNIKTGSESLVAYAIQKLFWFFILLYLLTRVSFSTYGFISNSKQNASSRIWITASSLFLSYILLLPIFKEGFYSFLPQLIATALALPIIIQLVKEKDEQKSYRALTLLFVICIGGCLSWLLPLPAFLLTTAIVVISLAINNRISTTIKNILDIIKDNFIILLLLSLATLTQIHTMISNHSDSSTSFISGLLIKGGITTYDKTFYIFLLIGFLASLIFASNKAKKNIYILLSLIVSLLLFCTFIYTLQISYLGKNEYYYYKTLDILTLAVIPFCITGFYLVIKKIIGEKDKIIMTIFLSIIILAAIIQIIGLDAPTLSFARGYRAFSSQIDNSLINELNSNISQDNYFNKRYTFYYTPGVDYYFQNEVANMMARSNSIDSNCFESIRHSIWKSPSINQLLDTATQECNGYKIDIVTNPTSLKSFKDATDSMGLSNSITIKSY